MRIDLRAGKDIPALRLRFGCVTRQARQCQYGAAPGGPCQALRGRPDCGHGHGVFNPTRSPTALSLAFSPTRQRSSGLECARRIRASPLVRTPPTVCTTCSAEAPSSPPSTSHRPCSPPFSCASLSTSPRRTRSSADGAISSTFSSSPGSFRSTLKSISPRYRSRAPRHECTQRLWC